MRRIVMFVVLAAPLAFPATAHAFGCIGGGFGRSFTLAAGRNSRPFSFRIPEAGTLRVELDYSHVANPHPALVVRLRRSTWKAAKTLIDSRPANACRVAAVTATCLGARPHTSPGAYHLGVHKLSSSAATVTINACWAAPPAEAGGIDQSFRLPAGPTHRRFPLPVGEAGTVRVRLVYSSSANPGAQFLVHLRRSNWAAALTLLDSRREGACRVAAGVVTCVGARAHTTAGSYFVGVRKLSPGPATVTLEASWP
jgi:hypothetical protein